MLRKCAVLLSCVFVGYSIFAQDNSDDLWYLVRNGEAQASIVVAPSASAELRSAIKDFVSYVERSTDVRIELLSNDSPTQGAFLHVGNTNYVKSLNLDTKDIGPQGFRFVHSGMNMCIVANTDIALTYGLYHFLEQYVGVRWLMAGDYGTHVPRRDSIAIKREKVQEVPVYVSRVLSPLDWGGSHFAHQREWYKYNRMGHRVDFHHNLYRLFNPDEFSQSHAHFYPMRHGVRIIPDTSRDAKGWTWQPNFSAEGIVDVAVERITEHFRKNPKLESYSLGINDNHEFDDSPESLKRRSGEKNSLGLEDVSDDYFAWANAVVERVSKIYPNKTFGTLAYTNVTDPPREVSIHPQIVPYMTYDRMQWVSPAKKAEDQRRTREWQAMSSRLGWYDYSYGSWYRLPRVYFRLMGEYLSWAADHNVDHYYAEIYPNWTGEGPKVWLTAKLLWNPYQNVDELVMDWCRAAVGEQSAPLLKEFYDMWEQYWVEVVGQSEWMTSRNMTYSNFSDQSYMAAVSFEMIERGDQIFKQALANDALEDQKERLARMHKMWGFYRMAVLTWQAEQHGKNKLPQTEQEALANIVEANRVLQMSRERKQMMDSFTLEDWNPHNFYYNNRWAKPNDANWGVSLLWGTRDWLERSEQVKQRVHDMAAMGSEAGKEHAQILLAALENKGEPLLTNPDFELGLEGWRLNRRTQGIGDVRIVGRGDGYSTTGVLIEAPITVNLVQNIPWVAGKYYAKVRFAIPEGSDPMNVVQAAFSPSMSLRGISNYKYILPTMDLVLAGIEVPIGELQEVYLPFIVPEGETEFESMVVSIQTRSPVLGRAVFVDSFQLYKVP